MATNLEKAVCQRQTTEVNNMLKEKEWHPAAGLEEPSSHGGCSSIILMDADKNKIIIKAVAFRGIFS